MARSGTDGAEDVAREGVEVDATEYGRWLIAESNWRKAEDLRNERQALSQKKHHQDVIHHKRGLESSLKALEQKSRMRDSVEYTKLTKQEAGRAVKEESRAIMEEKRVNQAEWASHSRELRDKTQEEVRLRDERNALLKSKQQQGVTVKREKRDLERTHEEQKAAVLAAKQEQVSKIRHETSDRVVDSAKKYFFMQRRAAADQVAEKLSEAEERRREVKSTFRANLISFRERARRIESGSNAGRKALAEKRQEEAAALRAEKRALKEAHKREQQAQQKERRTLVRAVSSGTANMQISVTEDHLRKMMSHPHYASLKAMKSDPTSTLVLQSKAGSSSMSSALFGSPALDADAEDDEADAIAHSPKSTGRRSGRSADDTRSPKSTGRRSGRSREGSPQKSKREGESLDPPPVPQWLCCLLPAAAAQKQ